MGNFIIPFTDFGFKRLFGQEDSKEILKDFLNALFHDEFCVVDLKYLDKEQLGHSDRERAMIYDIFCVTADGRRIIVEMQNRSHVHFVNRALYYSAKAIVAQAQKGIEWQYELCPVIGIYFMNFSESVLPHRVRSDYFLQEKDSHERLSDRMRLVFLQMSLFTKTERECTTELDQWMYIMNHMETLNQIPWKAQNELFRKLEEMSKIAAMTPREQAQYDEYLRQYRDNNAVHSKAIQDGIEIGREEGLKEGRKEGLKEGHKEGLRETARAMLTENLDESLISRVTGLSIDEIRKLS